MEQKRLKTNSQIYQLVGDRIRLQRKLLNYSAAQLGALVGVSQQQISRYERGQNRMTISCLFNIAEALQISVRYLLEDVIFFQQKIK